jgi:hypothetical protein
MAHEHSPKILDNYDIFVDKKAIITYNFMYLYFTLMYNVSLCVSVNVERKIFFGPFGVE